MPPAFSPVRLWLLRAPSAIYGVLLAFFLVAGTWLMLDLQQGYQKLLTDTALLATQRSQIMGQAFRTKVLASDYVLRDVLGRIEEKDLVYPDPDREHAKKMSKLLKDKADTVPDFFSMVMFNRDCVFTVTATGKNIGVKSKQELCDARKAHAGAGPLASYVPGKKSASGQPVLVLSRHLRSPAGEFLGGVLGAIELDQAQRLFESPGLSLGDSVALFDDSQVLLARKPLLADAIEKLATTLNVPRVIHTAAPQGSALTQWDMDGRERIFGFSKIEDFPFIVAYGFDKKKVIEDWQRRAVELTVGYVTLLLLALLVARSYWTTLRQREALRASEEYFRMLAENMADIVWRIDPQMRFTYINAADQRVRGFAREEVVGTYFRDNLTPQGQAMLEQQLRAHGDLAMAEQNGAALKYELPVRHKNGGEVWIEMSSVPIHKSDGHIDGYQGIGRDITRRRQHEAMLLQSNQQLENQLQTVAEEKATLQELSARDALTGLYNRRFLDAALQRELARAQREGKQLAVILLDLDHFKKINDQYGHAAGDDVLKMLAELLKTGARESDLICRYGGEEFVAIMPNMSADQALERAQSWRKQLEATRIPCAGFDIRCTLSAGIAVFPDNASSPAQLLRLADEMLYQSKHEGRNRISLCPQHGPAEMTLGE